ncbi:MAG: hypothetical protein JXP73_06565 [Deltaproteobacteria bacterium]|nr:hypothetical protein [Deltaproteobacteria bacterium]
MKRTALLLVASAMFVAAACKDKTQSLPPPPPPAPAKPAVPKQVVDAGSTGDARQGDARLGMMERYAIWKAKKEADEKLAAQLAAEERARLVKFDRSKLAKHQALFAFEKKTRKALDQAALKLNGKLDASDQLKKLAASQRKALDKQAANLRAMDPKGGSSFIGTDHDVILNLLANDYPAAILSFFQGQTKPLAEVRAELDKREKKIGGWLEEVKRGGK